MAKVLGVSVQTVKHHISSISLKYHIDSERFIPSVRIVYLRAKELGLL